jgi:tetratricopeptide (TPR) repeat protein
MSAGSASDERLPLFKNAVIVMLTLISVFAALVTFLQNYASLRSSDLAEQSSFAAVSSSGKFLRAGLDAAQGTDVLQRYEDYIQRAIRADTKARALRMGGRAELALEYDLDADRWRQAGAQVRLADPLMVEFGSDPALYREELSRLAYAEEEWEYALLDQSRAWNVKANSYVAVLSTLSVSLFLAGLSLTLGTRLRYVLALASAGLSLACAGWVAVISLTPVPHMPDEAIQSFVDGRIKYNLATSSNRDAADAIGDFDAALAMAPDYGRAYFYRSLANTASSLLQRNMNTQQAIDDARRAIELGYRSAPVYGNLGWLHYLNGQYNSALANTEIALGMSPNDCYLPFNRGLTLMALQREAEATSAYSQAIDCALRQTSDRLFNYYMDIGVIDLEELAKARPDLASSLEPAIRRLKEGLAGVRMYGELVEPTGSARFEPLQFGSSVSAEHVVLNIADEFPQTTTVLYAQITFRGMRPESRWMTRWLLDGQEYLSTVYDNWAYGSSGSTWVSVYNNAGLNSGTYELDVFVDGRLVTRGEALVLPGRLPPMHYYASRGVGVTISYPLEWNVTDLADNEVSVVAVRDADTANFFGVTAWLATSGTDQDILDLFQLYFNALQNSAEGFSSANRMRHTMAGGDGWLQEYTYTGSDGLPHHGALAGIQDPSRDFTYIVVLEAYAADWDQLWDVLDVMLRRMTIDR